MRPHGISLGTFIVYLHDFASGLWLSFGTLLSLANLPTFYASYPVPACQAMISLPVLLPTPHDMKLASRYQMRLKLRSLGNFILALRHARQTKR